MVEDVDSTGGECESCACMVQCAQAAAVIGEHGRTTRATKHRHSCRPFFLLLNASRVYQSLLLLPSLSLSVDCKSPPRIHTHVACTHTTTKRKRRRKTNKSLVFLGSLSKNCHHQSSSSSSLSNHPCRHKKKKNAFYYVLSSLPLPRK